MTFEPCAVPCQVRLPGLLAEVSETVATGSQEEQTRQQRTLRFSRAIPGTRTRTKSALVCPSDSLAGNSVAFITVIR